MLGARNLLIDPPSYHYEGNRLFDAEDKVLNRDDTLQPFIRLNNYLNSLGKSVSTADSINFSLSDPTTLYLFPSHRS